MNSGRLSIVGILSRVDVVEDASRALWFGLRFGLVKVLASRVTRPSSSTIACPMSGDPKPEKRYSGKVKTKDLGIS